MMLEMEAPCPFCGQLVLVRADERSDERMQEELAAEQCMCSGAMRQRRIRDGRDKLKQIGGADALANGFDEPMDDAAMDAARKAIEWLIDQDLREVQFTCGNGDRLRLRAEGSGVKLSRKSQHQVCL